MESLTEYYFDIETAPTEQYRREEWAAIDPAKAKIISIQYQPLDGRTGKPLGELVVLREWEDDSSEKIIVEKFRTLFVDGGKWNFVPIGNNLGFENRFMKYKLKQFCGLDGLRLGHRPMVDLIHVMIIMNGGDFRNSTRFLGKLGLAANMTEWYYTKDWPAIENYVRKEAEDFVDAYTILKEEIPKIKLPHSV